MIIYDNSGKKPKIIDKGPARTKNALGSGWHKRSLRYLYEANRIAKQFSKNSNYKNDKYTRAIKLHKYKVKNLNILKGGSK